MKKELATTINTIRENQCISGSELSALARYCGDRFWKALRTVANDLVKKYVFEPSGREAWIVVGKSRDYRVLSEIYCDCEDFYINVIIKRSTDLCYHILSKILAGALGVYSEIRVDDMIYDTLQVEWETLPEVQASRKSRKGSIE